MFNWVLNTSLIRMANKLWTYNILLPKRREHLNFIQLASVVYIFLRSVEGSNFLTQVQRKMLQRKTLSVILAGLMRLWISTAMIMRCIVHKYQITPEALRLRKNTFFCVHFFPYCEIFCWTEHQWSLAEYDFSHGTVICRYYVLNVFKPITMHFRWRVASKSK